NIIIDPDGQVHLTHVSPLLYNDPAQDTAAVVNLLRQLSAPTVTEADTEKLTLRQLAARLTVKTTATAPNIAQREGISDRRTRWRTLISARWWRWWVWQRR